MGSFDHKPTYDQFLALDSAQREHQQGQASQMERGILEKVQQKMEREEKEKEQIRLAKEAQEMQEKAFKEAELITQHKIMRKAAHQQEALSQAANLIQMIKKGNVNAQQLSQIMLGQMDLASVIEEEQAPVPTPISLPTITKEIVEP